jgi:hypothetical protein
MPSAAELRAELRALRKQHVRPVSRMKVGDISSEIDKLRGMREETPAPAATPSAPLRKSKAAVESVKEAKAAEFPVKPADKAVHKKAGEHHAKADMAKAPAEKKKSKLAKLLEMMEDDE